MYTRVYSPEDAALNVPENYDGNAFRESISDVKEPSAEPVFVPKQENSIHTEKKDDDGILAGLFKKLPLQNVFGGLGIKSLSSFKFGSEEILIVGIALFLFFSKSGDNELAFMLLLLLFIG